MNKIFITGDPEKTVRENIKLKKENKNFRVCKNCVMDNSIKNLKFNKDGICEYCINVELSYVSDDFDKNTNLNKYLNILKKHKKNNYNAILGVSGGVDSSFLAMKCKEWGLNILLVHLDNGWNTNESVRNIKSIQNITKFDLYTHVINWEEFKRIQLSFLKSGLANFEAPSDHAIFALLFKVAHKKKIPYILTGVNVKTESFVNLKDKNKTFAFGYSYGDLYHLEKVYNSFYKQKLNTYPKLSYLKRFYLETVNKIKKIELLNLIDFNKKNAIEYLEKNSDWLRYPSKHFESIITRFHQSYILPVKFGLDKRSLHLSNLIWSKQINRETAIVELEKDICKSEVLIEDYYFFLKKLDLNENEFKIICLSENKKFSDYPNAYFFYNNFKKIRSLF